MKLLLELLGMTSACNLNCTYCEWKKEPIRPLGPEQVAKAGEHLRAVADVMREAFPTVVFVEYSGGEPYVHPGIVRGVLEAFSDRWVRISTNGTLIDAEAIKALAGQKAYVALSLDGASDDANAPRFRRNSELLHRVLGNIHELLLAGVPVMLLCTLNGANIDSFPEFCQLLQDVFGEAIERGQLTLPAHFVSEFDRVGARPTVWQIDRFEGIVRCHGERSPLIAPIMPHYERLIEVMQASTVEALRKAGQEHQVPRGWRSEFSRTCLVHDWQVCTHFLGDSIATDGAFRSWGCGMRAVGDMGTYRSGDGASMQQWRARMDQGEAFGSEGPIGTRCPLIKHCFVDWNAIDMVFSGEVSLEAAQAWCVMFRDEQLAQATRMAQAHYRPRMGAS